MRKRIFTAILGLSVFAALAMAVFSVWFMERDYAAGARDTLLREARVLDRERQKEAPDGYQELARDFAEASGTRVTIVDSGGKVLADSAADPGIMASHEYRREIREAREEGTGYDRRRSATTGEDRLYVAFRGGDGIIVRLSVPLVSAFERMNSAWWILIAALLCILAVSLVIARRLSHSLSEPVLRITRTAHRIAEGHWEQKVAVEGEGEMRELTQSVAVMTEAMNNTLRELNENNARISTVLTAMSSGVVAVSPYLRVIMFNPAAERMLETRIKKDEHIMDVLWDPNLEGILISVMRLHETVRREQRMGERFLRMAIAPMIQGEKTIGAVAVMEDVTELRKLEVMRKEFVANVSHELKTPLTSIKGFAETLRDGALEQPEQAKRFLTIIDEEADRLTRLINDILNLSRMENQQEAPGEPLPEPVHFGRLVEDTAEMLAETARKRGLELTVSVDPGPLLVRVKADDGRQMILNLVDNALKYTPEGGRVAVSVRNAGETLIFSVSDTGIGIAKEHIPRLFERFYRVDKGRSRALGGTGLGLAIVKHIVLAMKGTIDVQSEEGKGTAFTVHIPKVKLN
ncbi:two-component system histidine kinase PnpS [Gehongia tenuis]|uniref:histidine kinase n=1 Tax=Gehongia tenuis TaxID=2763655 RepID=A0A926D1X0_9FIRM|nr:ATP-binding protein [Gehongia tenuis]MBC8530875.1 HAMP domain-containing protein [Gehongia tenuis]